MYFAIFSQQNDAIDFLRLLRVFSFPLHVWWQVSGKGHNKLGHNLIWKQNRLYRIIKSCVAKSK